ncbi:MAG: alpha/beta fold hydrolase [Mycobacterium sp.]
MADTARWGALLAALLIAGLPGPARAHADDPYHPDDPYYNDDEYTAFYTPPDPLPPGRPGDLIRTEASALVLEPSGQLGAIMATGTRIMYRSVDSRGNPMAVTGTYFEPYNPWPGAGPRPLLVYGPGTQGLGDQCAPSRQFNQGVHFAPFLDLAFNYEALYVSTLVARGFAVVMTDYQGLGTPGVHTYVNRVAEADAMLDAGRAAMRLPGTSLHPNGPVALMGYSQGGGASAAAAELAPDYAPELNIVGAVAGAPPADLLEQIPFTDGSVLAGVIGYALNSAIATYPEYTATIRATLTPMGEKLLADTATQCIAETVLRFRFKHLQDFFAADVSEVAGNPLFRAVFEAQKLGRLRPQAPVFILSNRYDPLVPWGPAAQLGRDWCARGADVQFWTNEQPPLFNKLAVNHALPFLVDGERVMQWLADRFNAAPTTPNCGAF